MFTKKWLVDMAERVVWTFLQAFFGTLLALGTTSVDWVILKSALIAAGLAVGKAILASRMGDKDSASTANV